MRNFLFRTKYISMTTVFLQQSEYYVGKTIHLSLYDANTGQELCIATTNIAGYIPAPGHVLIKDWSENEGVYKALFKAGVVGPIVRRVPAGFVEAYECELLKAGRIDPDVRDRVLQTLEKEDKNV